MISALKGHGVKASRQDEDKKIYMFVDQNSENHKSSRMMLTLISNILSAAL